MYTLNYEKFSLIGTISGWRWMSNDGLKISKVFDSLIFCLANARLTF